MLKAIFLHQAVHSFGVEKGCFRGFMHGVRASYFPYTTHVAGDPFGSQPMGRRQKTRREQPLSFKLLSLPVAVRCGVVRFPVAAIPIVTVALVTPLV